MRELSLVADKQAREELGRLLVGRGLSAGSTAFAVVMHLEQVNAPDFATAMDSDVDLNAMFADLRAIAKAHSQPLGNVWPVGEGPPEFEALRDQADERIDAIHARFYEQAGQATLAQIVRHGRLIELLKNSAPMFARECAFKR